jgi:hypothetical protein
VLSSGKTVISCLFSVQGVDVETFSAEVQLGDGHQPIEVSTIK